MVLVSEGLRAVMWRRITVVAVLALGGCAPPAAERNAPNLDFAGPIRPLTLSAAQIKVVQKGIAASLEKGDSDPVFGSSYRAGVYSGREIVVCGFVNGKRFVGMFAKPEGGSAEFLPIKIALGEEQQPAVRQYCRANGIYLPQ
jgi:hypothetical protein